MTMVDMIIMMVMVIILMKKGPKIRAGASPPLIRAMPESKYSFFGNSFLKQLVLRPEVQVKAGSPTWEKYSFGEGSYPCLSFILLVLTPHSLSKAFSFYSARKAAHPNSLRGAGEGQHRAIKETGAAIGEVKTQ